MSDSSEDYWFKMLKLNAVGYDQRINQIKQILNEKRGYVFEKPLGEYVIILFSGGMDSTTLTDMVIKEWNSKVILLYFRRDSRNQKWEEKAVDYFHEFYKSRYPQNIVKLVKLEIQIPSRVNKQYLDETRKKIMGLPMRNATMWCNAVTQAVYLSGKYEETIRTILVGSVNEDTHSPESGHLSVLSQSLHTCICLGIWNYQFNAPLMDDSFRPRGFSKSDLVRYARENGIPIEKSRSCFEATEEPCGKCLACQNRIAAFEAANQKEPNYPHETEKKKKPSRI
nr:7-cyano-7-deazaguanine synthase [Candidatus Freyarchaeota archaeon]